MAETTSLNIRIDKEIKKQADVFFAELGLNMSSAFSIFVRQSLRAGRIHQLWLTHFTAKQTWQLCESLFKRLMQGKSLPKLLMN